MPRCRSRRYFRPPCRLGSAEFIEIRSAVNSFFRDSFGRVSIRGRSRSPWSDTGIPRLRPRTFGAPRPSSLRGSGRPVLPPPPKESGSMRTDSPLRKPKRKKNGGGRPGGRSGAGLGPVGRSVSGSVSVLGERNRANLPNLAARGARASLGRACLSAHSAPPWSRRGPSSAGIVALPSSLKRPTIAGSDASSTAGIASSSASGRAGWASSTASSTCASARSQR